MGKLLDSGLNVELEIHIITGSRMSVITKTVLRQELSDYMYRIIRDGYRYEEVIDDETFVIHIPPHRIFKLTYRR